jgi:hypothetical protein
MMTSWSLGGALSAGWERATVGAVGLSEQWVSVRQGGVLAALGGLGAGNQQVLDAGTLESGEDWNVCGVHMKIKHYPVPGRQACPSLETLH